MPYRSALFTFCVLAASAAGVFGTLPGQQADAQGNAPAGLEVTIAVPEHRGQRAIRAHSPSDHFHVVLTNTGRQALRVWSEGCSWGYSALTFELTGSDGKVVTARKKPVSFRQNVPDFLSLAPGEKYVINVYPGAEAWEHFLTGKAGTHTYTMRAIFRVEADNQARAAGVWTGQVHSKTNTYVLTEG